MKGLFIFIASAIVPAICSCQTDDNFFPASSRLDTQRESGNAGRDSVSAPPVHSGSTQVDTEIICTAVRFPRGFDWRKDTTCGTSDCEILLYENGVIKEIIDVGKEKDICSDADMNHLIGMNVFSESSSFNETVVKKDGFEIARYEEREILKGLVFQEGDVFTLGMGQDGHGFSYRKNGEVILKKDYNVSVFGCMDDTSYPETGGLYEAENGSIIFCYKEMKNNYEYHVVKDGVDRKVNLNHGSKVLDMKVIEDSIYFAEREAFEVEWEEARVPYDAPYLVTGCVDGSSVVYDRRTGEMSMLCGRNSIIYTNGEVSAALYHPTRGKFSVYYSNGECQFSQVPSYYFTGRSACMVGDELMIAVNPIDETKAPYLSIGNIKYELGGLDNGFISGIRVTVSQSN